MWWIDEQSLEDIAIGAGILGTGGGGNPYYGKLHVRRLLAQGARIPIVAPAEVPDDALVVSVGGMGAPTVSIERIARGDEPLIALRALENHLRRQATHLIPGEIGGSNSTRPMAVSAMSGLPVVDGDGMGRAFPELQMETFSIYGIATTPAAIADIHHNITIFPYLQDAQTLERYARAVTVQMGGSSGYAFPAMTGLDAKRTAVPMTLTLARRLGEAVRLARQHHDSPLGAIRDVTGGQVIFQGKVIDVQRRMAAGFSRGTLEISGLGAHQGGQLSIDFQNENLIARRDGEVIAVVPDLICIVDAVTGGPITTEVVRYGLRVAVIGIPAPRVLKTPEALAVIGPAAFGYADVAYQPLPGSYGSEHVAAS